MIYTKGIIKLKIVKNPKICYYKYKIEGSNNEKNRN